MLRGPAPGLQHRDSVSQLDGFEPRIFPGVMSGRRRRSSVARPGSGSFSDSGDGSGGWVGKGVVDGTAEAVLVEEPEESPERRGDGDGG